MFDVKLPEEDRNIWSISGLYVKACILIRVHFLELYIKLLLNASILLKLLRYTVVLGGDSLFVY